MNAPSDHPIESLDQHILIWARGKFLEELHSDFERLEKFDDRWSSELLSVLKKQPADNFEILANVLPLGVFWQGPNDLERLRELPPKERAAVERFRADYDGEYKFFDHVEHLRRIRKGDMRREFVAAARKGKKIVNEIGSKWKWEIVGGGGGEWGLVSQRRHFRITVSLNLSRDLSISYSITLFDTIRSTTIRYQEDYPSVLGLRRGGWKLASVEELPEKLNGISDFALWHVGEYEKICELLKPI